MLILAGTHPALQCPTVCVVVADSSSVLDLTCRALYGVQYNKELADIPNTK